MKIALNRFEWEIDDNQTHTQIETIGLVYKQHEKNVPFNANAQSKEVHA